VLSDLVNADLPPNRELLAHLRLDAHPRRPDDPYPFGDWRLRTHPDLVERLQELAPDDHPVLPLYGAAVLAANSVVAVAAWGTGMLLVRHPDVPPTMTASVPVPPPLAGLGWRAVRPWRDDLPDETELRQLRDVVAAALRHAATLS
jgi:hypothetical protein